MDELEKRRQARRAIEKAENHIECVANRMDSNIPMEPTTEQLAENPQQAITLNIEWIDLALHYRYHTGWRACMDIWQPVIDYVNKCPGNWREVFEQAVIDPELRVALYKAFDAI